MRTAGAGSETAVTADLPVVGDVVSTAVSTVEATSRQRRTVLDPQAELERDISALELRTYYALAGVEQRAVRALGQATAASLPDLAGRAQLVLADILRRRRRPAEAARAVAAVRADAEDRGDRVVAARADLVLARALDNLGLTSEAMRLLAEAIRQLPADAPLHLRLDQTLARAIMQTNQLPGTDLRHVFDGLLHDTAGTTDIGLRIAVLNTNAFTSLKLGDLTRARAAVTELDDYVEENSLVLDSNAQDTRACVFAACGELAEAEAAARACLDPDIEHTEVFGPAQAMVTLAHICQLRGHADEAMHWTVRARRAARADSLAEFEATALRLQAELFAEAGNFEAAYHRLTESGQAWERVRGVSADAQAVVLEGVFEVEQQRREAQRLAELAERDALTGLHNRRHLDRVLPVAQTTASRTGEPLSVAMLDLDGFKAVNDLRSHLLGDAVLERFASVVTDAVRPVDILVRLGGDEFVLILPGADIHAAARICRRIHRDVAGFPWSDLTSGLPVTVSIGVAAVGLADGPTDALDRADRALYRAKRSGRNRVVQTAA
jgi:two-component system cell cycle response regulator